MTGLNCDKTVMSSTLHCIKLTREPTLILSRVSVTHLSIIPIGLMNVYDEGPLPTAYHGGCGVHTSHLSHSVTNCFTLNDTENTSPLPSYLLLSCRHPNLN